MSDTSSASTEWWADPTILGWMAFGATTILAGVSFTTYGGLWNSGSALPAMAVAFGGLVMILAGIIALRKGHAFSGTAIISYGAFYLAFSAVVTTAVAGGTGAEAAAMWFGIVWCLVTFTFLLSAPKFGLVPTVFFLFLFVGYILMAIDFGTLANSNTLPGWYGNFWGLEFFITVLIAWYLASAHLTNNTYGRKIFPV